jgi:hypothetical protein
MNGGRSIARSEAAKQSRGVQESKRVSEVKAGVYRFSELGQVHGVW